MSGCSFVSESVALRATGFDLREGDILISMTGYVGQVAEVRSKDLPAMLNQRVGRFTVKDDKNLNRRFLYYCVTDAGFRKRVEALGYGSAQPNVSPKAIHGIEIPLPAISDQTAIAHILGTLDDKIELNRRTNETLEAMARALFKDWFVDFGPTSRISRLISETSSPAPSTAKKSQPGGRPSHSPTWRIISAPPFRLAPSPRKPSSTTASQPTMPGTSRRLISEGRSGATKLSFQKAQCFYPS